jgi:hypothetical protein
LTLGFLKEVLLEINKSLKWFSNKTFKQNSKVLNPCENSINTIKTKTKNLPQNLIKSWDVTTWHARCRVSKLVHRGYNPLGCWQAGVDEMPSSPRNTHKAHEVFYHGSGRKRDSRKTLCLACLSLLDEDDRRSVYKSPEANELNSQPSDLVVSSSRLCLLLHYGEASTCDLAKCQSLWTEAWSSFYRSRGYHSDRSA